MRGPHRYGARRCRQEAGLTRAAQRVPQRALRKRRP